MPSRLVDGSLEHSPFVAPQVHRDVPIMTRRRKIVLGMAAVVVVAVAAWLFFASERYVTSVQFGKISDGMTYDQVEQIFAFPGKKEQGNWSFQNRATWDTIDGRVCIYFDHRWNVDGKVRETYPLRRLWNDRWRRKLGF